MKILIALLGSHTQPEHMAAQRETWLQDLDDKADYKYCLGLPGGSEPDVLYLYQADGPLWERRGDGVSHRTWVLNRKVEALCRYAVERDYDYVFKCDDDTYVNVDRLLASGFEQHDYSGSTDRHKAEGIGEYRWCQGGAGYWLSNKAAAIVAESGLTTIRAEDFAVGGLLHRHGIHPQHDERYLPAVSEEFLEQVTAQDDWITLHKINPAWMRRLHARFAATN